ncbi:MAG: hypothetical protein Ta2B_30730 [Termitinemataceae bacterium]|nr:MAG: hypothetical protein Ta2B_30730 [Termitinemataceae bacterium]
MIFRLQTKMQKKLIAEGRKSFKKFNLADPKNIIIERGTDSVLFTFLGDRENRTLVLLLKYLKVSCYAGGMAITIHNKKKNEVLKLLKKLRDEKFPDTNHLLKFSQNLFVEKWDKVLPPALLIKNYESLYLAPKEVKDWLKTHLPQDIM